MLDTHGRKFVQPIIHKTATHLLRMGLTANQVTIMAFFTGISSGIWFFYNQPILAVIFLWLSGYLDAVDGSMARMTKPSPWGTVMDVTFDRLVEISVILGIAFLYPELQWALLLLSVSIIFSITIFLTVGAVSEKQGMKSFYYQAGVAERTEGFIFLTLMMLVEPFRLEITLIFVAVEIFTGIQRMLEARKLLKDVN
ncbi:CDP-alcohol phosphatidyltransferase family protein [Cytobacillus spongiae]|uniref:CDP-alcohol phosphatidyltransferase family protein n=1 Tax=Cytobacillus spongiae TaxID=2901381 RepID=UPI001F34F349|nr:CDP-alcohol phosphatidyltransferase family protein [Cytobacillus spongiae]UII54153.1 CDP-alcohol phosphatidyltransferase family protein [Cytobacillus spongiae]